MVKDSVRPISKTYENSHRRKELLMQCNVCTKKFITATEIRQNMRTSKLRQERGIINATFVVKCMPREGVLFHS